MNDFKDVVVDDVEGQRTEVKCLEEGSRRGLKEAQGIFWKLSKGVFDRRDIGLEYGI